MHLNHAVKDFLADRRYRNLSENTIESYILVMDMFCNFCKQNNVENIEDVKPVTVKSFMHYLQDKGNNATSRNSKLRTLKTFFNYMEQCELFEPRDNPAKKMMYGKEEISIQPFTDEQIHQMLGYLRRQKQRIKTFPATRNYMIIVFLLSTGVRLGEILNLRWSDIDLINGNASILGKKRELSSVPLMDKLIKELLEYRYFCEHNFGGQGTYVFPTDENKQMKPDSAKCIFKRLQKVFNFPNRLSAHSFRHTFAVKCIQNGMDAFTLQRLLRHSDLSMTNRYVRMFGTALKSQNEKFNPLNGINL